MRTAVAPTRARRANTIISAPLAPTLPTAFRITATRAAAKVGFAELPKQWSYEGLFSPQVDCPFWGFFYWQFSWLALLPVVFFFRSQMWRSLAFSQRSLNCILSFVLLLAFLPVVFLRPYHHWLSPKGCFSYGLISSLVGGYTMILFFRRFLIFGLFSRKSQW